MSTPLDPNAKQKTSYCIPLWLRDEQVKASTARIKGRIEAGELKHEPIAIVCFGPSLNDTWEQVKGFKHVMTCSGAHKFMVERGIVPTYHAEVDPRAHKVKLIGPPQKGTQYLIASTCHADVFDHLEGFDVKLWHIFDPNEEGLRMLPPGEWALTGGCSVGLRTMTVARFLGFTDLHIFGMDGCEGATGKHAAEHPMQPKDNSPCVYEGKTYLTTPSMLETARQTWHELDEMPDVKATFYGEGLVQAMAKNYVRNPKVKSKFGIALVKGSLITDEYTELNRQLHAKELGYGVGGGRHAPTVLTLMEKTGCKSVLDYGCGKGYLGKALPFPIWEYDPAVPEKSAAPRPAELVVCTDVLEHIEPECLMAVLGDLQRCTVKVGFFVIHTGPARKTLPDGRNTHLIQKDEAWWRAKLSKFFEVGDVKAVGKELWVVVGPQHYKEKTSGKDKVRGAEGEAVGAQGGAARRQTIVAGRQVHAGRGEAEAG